MTGSEFEAWLRDPNRRPLVMGVLNVTPDSFSDGGRYLDPQVAAEQAAVMTDAGAAIIDIGAESTRPGSARVTADEQLRRILPVLRGISRSLRAVVSVDTTLAEVAEAALDAGASIINDISAGMDDPPILKLAARRRCPIILMHMLGQPATMQLSPSYKDVTGEVAGHLADRMGEAVAAGVEAGNILLDPGIGFGKTPEHNLQLLRELGRLVALGRPVVIGTSRKSFIAKVTGETDPGSRLMGTAASVAWSVAHGAAVVRVHDVEPAARVARMIRAIQTGRVEQ